MDRDSMTLRVGENHQQEEFPLPGRVVCKAASTSGYTSVESGSRLEVGRRFWVPEGESPSQVRFLSP